MTSKIIVFPVYNEEKRIKKSSYVKFIENNADFQFIFVDDGSTDHSLLILQEIQKTAPERIHIKQLGENSGKAEAVRQGLLGALALDVSIVGYADVDLSTPFHELKRLADTLEKSQYKVLLGSRVMLLGKHIKRNMLRHYLGRVFATLASVVLKLPVYDTQCGAKFFKNNDILKTVLKKPFRSRWVFDIEIIRRLLKTKAYTVSDFVEEPLNEWTHVSGSKLSSMAMLKAVIDLLKIGIRG